MQLKTDASHLVAYGAIIVILVALILVIVRFDHDGRSRDPGSVSVVPGTTSGQSAPLALPPIAASTSPVSVPDPQQLGAAVVKTFPMIREANIVCEDECRLIAALGDQMGGPSPHGGNLERFLVAQGYTPKGDLQIEQPGDNDTLLIVPVNLPPGNGSQGKVP